MKNYEGPKDEGDGGANGDAAESGGSDDGDSLSAYPYRIQSPFEGLGKTHPRTPPVKWRTYRKKPL